MQDEHIVESVLGGDIQAFELLVLKYQKPVFRSVLSILKNEAEAEDITQEAFVKAYEKLSTLQNRAGFYAWIKRIGINLALNQYDKNKWMVDVTSDNTEYDFFDNVPVYQTPEGEILKDELKKYIKLFIDSLPEKLRLVLVLREIDELSYEDISEMLKIPVGTVRSRLFNARQILKDRLLKQGLADELSRVN
ncbi:MAG: sigma-70 family RNA polymerase sigma factor [Deferribacteraceae bacterium]|jgi:RNA polymerase sigma-70 factor (ECF subfamily)|nr:sigma-70 family RNA polymerase sigma factor [Deferribacteraceae bacterium]